VIAAEVASTPKPAATIQAVRRFRRSSEKWPTCVGTDGRFASERMADLRRNRQVLIPTNAATFEVEPVPPRSRVRGSFRNMVKPSQ